MTDVILATMMTAEVVTVVDVMTTTMVVDGTMTGQEIMTEETVTAVVMVEIDMMTGGIKGRQRFYWLLLRSCGCCHLMIYCLGFNDFLFIYRRTL